MRAVLLLVCGHQQDAHAIRGLLAQREAPPRAYNTLAAAAATDRRRTPPHRPLSLAGGPLARRALPRSSALARSRRTRRRSGRRRRRRSSTASSRRCVHVLGWAPAAPAAARPISRSAALWLYPRQVISCRNRRRSFLCCAGAGAAAQQQLAGRGCGAEEGGERRRVGSPPLLPVGCSSVSAACRPRASVPSIAP